MKCNALTGELCDEKETAYLAKVESWTEEKKKNEIERLTKLLADGSGTKASLLNWIERRSKLLQQLVPNGDEAEL
jgi:hypothetical protein